MPARGRSTDSRPPGSPLLAAASELPIGTCSTLCGSRRRESGLGQRAAAGPLPSWALAVTPAPERRTDRARRHCGGGAPPPSAEGSRGPRPASRSKPEPSRWPSAMEWGCLCRLLLGGLLAQSGGAQGGLAGASGSCRSLPIRPRVPPHPLCPSRSCGNTRAPRRGHSGSHRRTPDLAVALGPVFAQLMSTFPHRIQESLWC